MNRFITDMIYNSINIEKTTGLEFAQGRLLENIGSHMERGEYLNLEEQFTEVCSRLEREVFCRGFVEGICFLMKCLDRGGTEVKYNE